MGTSPLATEVEVDPRAHGRTDAGRANVRGDGNPELSEGRERCIADRDLYPHQGEEGVRDDVTRKKRKPHPQPSERAKRQRTEFQLPGIDLGRGHERPGARQADFRCEPLKKRELNGDRGRYSPHDSKLQRLGRDTRCGNPY